LPNLLKYFNDHITANNNNKSSSDLFVYEECILSLLVEYLLDHKKVIEIDTNYSNEETETTNECFEYMLKKKNLYQIRRLLDDKNLTCLHSNLVNYFESICSNHKDFNLNHKKIELCILAPLFIQNSDKIESLILSLCKTTIKKLQSNQEKLKSIFSIVNLQNSESFIDEYETDCLLFSLSIWSLMHFEKKNESFYSACSLLENKSIFECLIDILYDLDELKNNIIINLNIYRFEFEKYYIHLIRALNYCLNTNTDSNKLFNQLDEKLKKCLNFLKNQLSSPIHEVKKEKKSNIFEMYFIYIFSIRIV
jgi:hypothetical protein